MIFGRTHEDRQCSNIYRDELWFAWRPVHLKDGRWIWLDYVWRKWECDELAPACCAYTYYMSQSAP